MTLVVNHKGNFKWRDELSLADLVRPTKWVHSIIGEQRLVHMDRIMTIRLDGRTGAVDHPRWQFTIAWGITACKLCGLLQLQANLLIGVRDD